MHLSDALISPAVALTTGAAALILTAVAVRRTVGISTNRIALMGVMGAFVFAAQMINFAIPGTGSSGHIVGGVLLAAVLGPWAGFLTLSSVLLLQAFVFADGGIMALGCNVINMAAFSTLVAYPLLMRPITGQSRKGARIMAASTAACTVGLLLGALAVTLESRLSGITALPALQFLEFMVPIHLVIGVCEGVATGVVIGFLARFAPSSLTDLYRPKERNAEMRTAPSVLVAVAIGALLLGGVFWLVACENPDGLEWSIAKVLGSTDLEPTIESGSYGVAEQIQNRTALMPDYNTSIAGIAGCSAILLLTVAATALVKRRRKRHRQEQQPKDV